jgi:hypothetical protein
MGMVTKRELVKPVWLPQYLSSTQVFPLVTINTFDWLHKVISVVAKFLSRLTQKFGIAN